MVIRLVATDKPQQRDTHTHTLSDTAHPKLKESQGKSELALEYVG